MSESLPTSEATHLVEDAVVERIQNATHPLFPDGLQLGVDVLPGRSPRKRPASYLAVMGDDQEPRHAEQGLWMVNATIWCVTETGDKNAAAVSKALRAKMIRWLRPGCPLIRWGNGRIFFHGLVIGTPVEVRRDYSFADVIPVRFPVRVY